MSSNTINRDNMNCGDNLIEEIIKTLLIRRLT